MVKYGHMNNIVFAGNLNELPCFRTGARYTVIVPAESNKGGKIFWEADGCKNEIDFSSDFVVVVPPSVNFKLVLAYPDDCICLVMERCPLPFKEITAVADDLNRGILHAAKQADEYLNGVSCLKHKTEVILSSLGGLIVSYLIASVESGAYSAVTKQILADIDKNVSHATFFIEDYLKTLPLNYDYVRKMFKKEVGETPREYLLKKRMELATHYLESGISNRYSPYSISQIAEACGFADPLYFSKVFKKYYGVAPGGYGKQNKTVKITHINIKQRKK